MHAVYVKKNIFVFFLNYIVFVIIGIPNLNHDYILII